MKKSKGNTQKGKNFKIKVTASGPYLVSGSIPLSDQTIRIDNKGECHGWKAGKEYPVSETYALCRCGHSKNKPFCDGTHTQTKFDGTEETANKPYMEQSIETNGPGLKLTDAKGFCASARFCHRDGGTWKLTEQSSDPDARQKAIEEACDCPSGRLVVWDKKNKPIEPNFEPSIGIVEDAQEKKSGPIWVRGGIPIESEDGIIYEIRNRVTLCRCGKSSNKPFCDGNHLK